MSRLGHIEQRSQSGLELKVAEFMVFKELAYCPPCVLVQSYHSMNKSVEGGDVGRRDAKAQVGDRTPFFSAELDLSTR
jgi:hypothetical protein